MIDQIAAVSAKLIRHGWVRFCLLGILLTVLTASLEDAHWVDHSEPVSAAVWLAVVLGAGLAFSRFRGRFAGAYGLFMSLCAAVQAVGGILPRAGEVTSRPFFEWVNAMNLRLTLLQLRVSGWVDTLNQGKDLKDTGLFIFLLALVLSLAVYWMMWQVLRKGDSLAGVLPLGLLVGINVQVSRQSLAGFGFFLLSTLLLMGRDAVIRQHGDWERRSVDYPEEVQLDWAASVVVIGLLVVVGARVTPLIATPQGQQAVADWAETFQRRTDHTAKQLFSGVNPPPASPQNSAAAETVVIRTPDLSEIDATLPQGSEIIMFVSTSDPVPQDLPSLPAAAAQLKIKSHYYRYAIYSTYTGRGWDAAALEPGEAAAASAAQVGEQPPAGRYFLRQTYQIMAEHRAQLFSVNEPVQPDPGLSLVRTSPDGSLLLEGKLSDYSVISAATNVSADELASAPVDYPSAIRSTYLQLPPELPKRVQTLAARVARSAHDPYHQALLVQNYLRENYTYSLSAPKAPGGKDLVDYFLFESQTGYCTHYASAMAVMLRSLGVPARVATGYATGTWNANQGAFQVSASNSHAWVEVYFSGYGWVEFEPTASQLPFIYRDTGKPAAPLEPLPARSGQAGPSVPWLLPAALAAAALALLLAPFYLARMFSLKGKDTARQVDGLYRQMRRALSRAGITADASLTPDEYLAAVSPGLEPYTRLSSALRQVTELYTRAVYSPHPPAPLQARMALREWQQSIPQWAALWVKQHWK